MPFLHKLRGAFLNLFGSGQADRDLDAEVRAHLELLTEEKKQLGMTAEQARRAARIELGGLEQVKEEVRGARPGVGLEQLWQDMRFGARQLRRNPGFALAAVLTLALGVGANTAIFSVVDAILLKPLPFAHSEQLYLVFQQSEHDASVRRGWSYAAYQELREQNHVFSELAGSGRHELTVTGHGEPAIVNASAVSPELFALLNARPLAGRTLLAEDGKPGAPAVVVLSEELWRGLFQGDATIIGSSIYLDKRPFTVVGVMPQSFRPVLSETKRLWIPLAQDPIFSTLMPDPQRHWLPVTARLKEGVSPIQAQAELDAISARLAQAFPGENSGWAIRMAPLQDLVVGDVRPALLLLWAAVGVVLLIACANIANLLLARATARSMEIAVRTTLGAGRARIVRQLLAESLLLGLLGGLAGIAMAYWGVHALGSLVAQSLPKVNAIRVDSSVLGFALALSAIASCAFGLAPAFFAAKLGLQASLREGGVRAGESGASRRLRNVLAAGEAALAVVLLVAAGLLLRSYNKLSVVNTGFTAEHVLKANIALPRAQYSTPQQWLAFADDLLGRLHAEPGLQDSALVVPTPIADGNISLAFDIVGAPPLKAGTTRTANYVAVTPEYFRVMGIPLLAGRSFDQHDAMSRPRVTLISRAMARVYFPDRDPMGQELGFSFPPDTNEPRQIVGIVGDVRDVAPGEQPGPMMYVPFAQAPFWGADVVVRSTTHPSAVLSALRRNLAQMDRDLPLGDVAQLPDALQSSMAQPRFRTLLLALFAAMALALSATGIFGVLSYSVSRRTQEIGIRVALGASHGAVLQMVVGETLRLALAGVAVGVPCALAASRLLGHMLFEVSASDPPTLVGVVLMLLITALLAAYVPVRRALRVDPMTALRHE